MELKYVAKETEEKITHVEELNENTIDGNWINAYSFSYWVKWV